MRRGKWYRCGGKRVLDVLIAAGSLVLLAPVILALSLVIAVNLGRPVIFRQQRPGLNGRPFTMLKFRTMSEGHDSCGELLPDAERLTSLGTWLRSTSLDELPELINVIAGQMSLIGPRPLLMEYLPLYSAEQARRHAVRPGITGWAQVHGRNELTWQEKFTLDVWYVNNVSLKVDVRILRSTLFTALSARGVNRKGHATSPRFTGRAGD